MLSISDIFGIDIDGHHDVFEAAITHPSVTKENNLPYDTCYERLEFLGDAVLKLTISDILYNMFPDFTEGQMSKIRSIVVSDSTLADIAKNNKLQKIIRISPHDEKQGCRNRDSICACAFEAVLGAYYIDGKYEQIKSYIKEVIVPYIEDAKNHFEKFNAKAILQEYTQEKTKSIPLYTVVNESGPDHKKVFEVQVEYENKILAVEKGYSKKEAEQKCAFTACKNLGIIQ